MRSIDSKMWLMGLILLYTAASLLHFAHNAEYLVDYPNLPASFSRALIYSTWCAIAGVGLIGFMLHRSGRPILGLAILGIYACFGFDGFLHYTRAPMDAHTFGMNFTIWFEGATAGLLLAAVVWETISVSLHRKTSA